MPRPPTIWQSISFGLATASRLLASLGLSGGVGWLIGELVLPAWRFGVLLVGLIVGLAIGVYLVLHQLASQK